MRRRPRELGSVLSEVRERLAPPDRLAAIQGQWLAAVGEQVARESWPSGERDGQVTVRCSSAVWAAELTMLSEMLLQHLNERLPPERQARGLKFTAAPSRSRFR